MPIYEFICKECGNSNDQVLKTAEQFEPCPTCQSFRLEKKISVPARAQFKGTGFYETDYKRKGK